jgi:hypothetical protein
VQLKSDREANRRELEVAEQALQERAVAELGQTERVLVSHDHTGTCIGHREKRMADKKHPQAGVTNRAKTTNSCHCRESIPIEGGARRNQAWLWDVAEGTLQGRPAQMFINSLINSGRNQRVTKMLEMI